jgi:hypothetical protein
MQSSAFQAAAVPLHRPSRHARAVATALAITALTAPAAIARPAAPDPPIASTSAEPRQDLRSPDARDAAATTRYASATVRPVVVQATQAGFDWGSAGIGAGAGIVLLSMGGALVRTRAGGRAAA